MSGNGSLQTEVSFQGRDGRLAGTRWTPVGGAGTGLALFLHGGGQTRHSWGRSAARLADHGWIAITVDARGHGESEWAPDGDYSLDAFVDDLERILASLDRPAVLVGASMGGMTALAALGERPDSARGLVLVDVAPRIDKSGRARIIEFMAGAPHGFGSLDEVAEAIGAYNPHRPRPRSLDGLRKNVRQRADGRWYWHWDPRFLRLGDEPARDAQEARLDSAAARITVPTMLVWGKQSDIVTPQSVAALCTLIPTARIEQVDAGHMVAGDDNDVFTAYLVDFLQQL